MSFHGALMASGHAVSLFGFAGLAALVLLGRASPYRNWIALAAVATALWSGAMLAGVLWTGRGVVVIPLEVLRSGGWTLALIALLGAAIPLSLRQRLLLVGLTLALPALVLVGHAALTTLLSGTAIGGALDVYVTAIAIIGLTIGGLTVLGTLIRHLGREGREAANLFLIGVGALYAFDFFLYATLLMIGRFDLNIVNILEARGLITAFSAPMIAIALARQREWTVDIHVSRGLVVQVAAALGGGFYLLVMAAVGFAVRELDGDWGPVFHIAFLSGAVILLFAVMGSGAARGRLQGFVSRNFYSNKYDYRGEWLRFSAAMAESGPGQGLEGRILAAVLETLGCSRGAIWVRSEDGAEFVLAAARPRDLAAEALPAAVAERIAATLAQDPRACPPEAQAHGTAAGLGTPWGLIPLAVRGELLALLVLAEPRTPRPLDLEDADLMAALASQTAGQLAEQRLAAALHRARRFETTARRVTYATHDLKNIANQLSLALQNWRRLEHNPAFRAELPDVLGQSVARIKALLETLKAEDDPAAGLAAEFDAAECIAGVLPLWRARNPKLSVRLDLAGARLHGRRDHLESIIDQLLANACEASGPEGDVALVGWREGRLLLLEVRDGGAGMDREALAAAAQGQLRSVKPAGFGIGLFQVRDHLRGFGGRLDLRSQAGSGTTARVTLEPVSFAPAPLAEAGE